MFVLVIKSIGVVLVLSVILVSSGISHGLAAVFIPKMVADINPDSTVGSAPSYLTALGDTLMFVANDGSIGDELWKSSPTGTSLVKDIAAGPDSRVPNNLIELNGKVYFTGNDNLGAGEELWVSDGTSIGTVLLKDINPAGNSNPARYGTAGGLLYFQATDGTNGAELWKSDGTTIGTVMVKDINPAGASSSPTILTDVNGTLFFVAIDDVHGEELWKSDGTPTGTVLVKDYTGTTNIHDVFAAGDVTDHPVKQVGTAVGQGITAALEAYSYIRQPYYRK